MLLDYCFLACYVLMFIMLYVMIIRLMTYMISNWDTPIFIWIHILCSYYSLTIMYIITLKHVHLHNDHIGFCLWFLHFMVLITCLDVVFIKTCVYICTINEPHLIIVYLCLIAHLYPLDVLAVSYTHLTLPTIYSV